MTRPSSLLRLLAVVPALLAAACSDDPKNTAGAPADAGADASPDAAPATGPLGLVVVNSDYMATAVSLVDPATGSVTKDNCITSGSAAAGLTMALSGDLVVPSMPQPGNEIALIDRTNTTLTWVTPGTCAVARQLNVGEGKPMNPYDLIPVSAHKAYVPRYATAAGDLLVIDPTAATITGHLDLKPSAPVNTPAVSPNPSRGVFTGGKVYVVLSALTDDSKMGAQGRVVVVDPATDAVTGTIDLTGLKNCGSIAAVGNALIVACGGLYGDPNQIAQSGVAWIDLSMSPPAVKIVAASTLGHAVSPFDIAAASSSLAFAITGGDPSGTPPDQLWAFDFAGGAPRKILDAKMAFTLSGLLFDAAHNKLFIADGDSMMPRLHVFDVTMPAAPVETSVTTNATGLPPRYVSWY
jgi:hypothetical protein